MSFMDQFSNVENLLRGGETGNVRSSILRNRNDPQLYQVAARQLEHTDEGEWLHLRLWADRLGDRPTMWSHLLINADTLGLDITATATTDKEAWNRVSRGMVERGIWTP